MSAAADPPRDPAGTSPSRDAAEASPLRGAAAVTAALEEGGVTLVASVPDTWIGSLMLALRRSRTVRIVDVVREEEAVAVACGAALCGARAAVVVQNAGLLNCGAILASLVHLYEVPCFLLVSYRGDERDPVHYHVPKGQRTEPTLTAWSIRYARAAGPERIGAQIRQGVAWADTARAPFALLFSAEDLA
ncbi:MAG TPA: thiamine pyrophosphate-binding protein [Candidatus Tectomicrobia bacterium]|nr:thiamine pyrophosphate-binding protein [Candidatus Tectomicrobia bacterium]